MSALRMFNGNIDTNHIEEVIDLFDYLETGSVIVAEVEADEIVGIHQDHDGIGSTYPVGVVRFTADRQAVCEGTLRKIVASENATCLVEAECHGVSRGSTFPHRVIIKHLAGADPEVVALTLVKAMFDSDQADLGLIKAFGDVDEAVEWVDARYDLEPSDRPYHAVVVDGKTIAVHDWPMSFFELDRPLAALVSHWGVDRLLGRWCKADD